MLKTFALASSIVFTSLMFAQNKTEFTITLKDGNIVTGTVKVTEVNLNTLYGKLLIPIKNISSIELGLRPDLSQKDNISNLAKQLLNSNEELRSKAFSSLVSLSIGAIPILDELVYSGNFEPSSYTDYTLSSALAQLQSTHGVSNYHQNDIVVIDAEYNMGGTYDFSNIELKTEYGVLNIPREKINKIDVSYFDSSFGNGKSIKLLASTHISSNANGGWVKTGITVKPGQVIKISANGEITMASLSGNKYKPDGSSKNVNTTEYMDSYSKNDYPTYGNVVFKIGETGTTLKAGANYNAVASQSGMIYLSIYETVYNSSNSGFYTVNVQIK